MFFKYFSAFIQLFLDNIVSFYTFYCFLLPGEVLSQYFESLRKNKKIKLNFTHKFVYKSYVMSEHILVRNLVLNILMETSTDIRIMLHLMHGHKRQLYFNICSTQHQRKDKCSWMKLEIVERKNIL